ncbi:CinA family protein [Homoserinibacter sp. YIM 151385]|uniref:CinA family protein n=1 Tax=Homoserinibacter sp. YIM 151385 TaxID=2985506 RepID=UPI0022F05DDF|nr:nicotinamide-nucleotide amidohydrolase family protein [Homoserinibacter sp. YIM 151385]WBU38900.1 nicotinamide-nucleotide amidohydrolase family protein [Homoserinibacter sp. YIM 151385]
MSAESLVAALAARGMTLAVAESLTGGLVASSIIAVPGASQVLLGGVVAYATALKRDAVGVDAALLEREGAVHPEVAAQLADRVRGALAVDGRPADAGIGTTGVAGPAPQDGRAPGTVFVAAAAGERVVVEELELHGSRAEIRAAAAAAALELLERALDPGSVE